MTTKQSLRYQLFAALCGFAFEILYTIFWAGLGHNLPPASPNLGAHELATFFKTGPLAWNGAISFWGVRNLFRLDRHDGYVHGEGRQREAA